MFLNAAFLLVLAQQAPTSQPAFKTGVNLVEVDVVVTDKAGRPVRGLRQTDFEVFEDNKPVPVTAFVAIDLPQAAPEATIPPLDASGTSIASNGQPEDGRVMLIVLDDYHVRFAGSQLVKAKAIARKMIERLGPSDQAAVIATSGRSASQAEFTGDKARLVEAIDRFFPQSERSSDGAGLPRAFQRASANPQSGGKFGFVEEIKARWAMETLSNAARALAAIPHRRKAILLVSEGLPASVEEIISSPNASGAWQSLRDFILTAQRSNVAIYPIDPCGLGTDCSFDAQQNLRTLAENTGGFAVVNTNAPDESVERIVAENGTYYLLGYPSPAPPDDGRRHRITVRTRLPGLDVRAREGYTSPRRVTRTPVAVSPLDSLIAAPIQTRGLTLRVAAVPAPLASSPGSAIVVAIELPAGDAIDAAGVDFTVVAIDTSGKVRARQGFRNTFEAVGASRNGWARLRTHLAVPSGRYQIRVAAVGDNKTQGSVFTEVNIPKLDGELAVGGLSLAGPSTGSAVNVEHMAAVSAITPLATREIPSNVPIAIHAPIRIAGKAASNPLTITATLVKPDGGTVQLDHGVRPAAGYSTAAGEVYRVALPAYLPAGSYRVVVNANLRQTRVTREIAFSVLTTP